MTKCTPSAMPRQILIVGAGVAGLASAISLSYELASIIPDLEISVFEGTSELSTSGGAISLTPTAQQFLDVLGVISALDQMADDQTGIEVDAIDLFSLQSGTSLGPLRFTDEKGLGYGGYKGRRVLRSALSQAMLTVARSRPNITVTYNKKLVSGHAADDESSVTLCFEDGTTATGDLALGCDGVHSATRTQIVDPGNTSRYTGISFIQSMFDARALTAEIPFAQTAVHLTRSSSLLTSFCDPSHSNIFVAAIIRVNESLVERYQAASSGTDNSATQDSMDMSIRHLVRTHFGQTSLAHVRELVDKTNDWVLYPVYQVRQSGAWHKGRFLLLGDAAHAMPPRDESAAYAIEDAILFSRLLATHKDGSLTAVFEEYENVRRATINKAFDASRRLWQSDMDRGLFPGQVRDLMSPGHESFSDLSVYSLTRELPGPP